jgi:hypothetical protein
VIDAEELKLSVGTLVQDDAQCTCSRPVKQSPVGVLFVSCGKLVRPESLDAESGVRIPV